MKTLADYLNYKPQNAAEDSYSFVSILNGNDESLDRNFIVSQSGCRFLAFQKNGWKLIAGSGAGGSLN
ncbi:MAG TPA: arylsulfatase, partial [Desulfobacterales bacterium]|nr:arylsulfatase [Desulfobacterales bacterium]